MDLILQVVSAIASIAISVIAYFLVRTLKQIDRNQSNLFQRIHDLETEFHTLKGEHTILAGVHHNRRVGD